jgi:hypothetical protein
MPQAKMPPKPPDGAASDRIMKRAAPQPPKTMSAVFTELKDNVIRERDQVAGQAMIDSFKSQLDLLLQDRAMRITQAVDHLVTTEDVTTKELKESIQATATELFDDTAQDVLMTEFDGMVLDAREICLQALDGRKTSRMDLFAPLIDPFAPRETRELSMSMSMTEPEPGEIRTSHTPRDKARQSTPYATAEQPVTRSRDPATPTPSASPAASTSSVMRAKRTGPDTAFKGPQTPSKKPRSGPERPKTGATALAVHLQPSASARNERNEEWNRRDVDRHHRN